MKLDIYPHIFPRRYFDKMVEVAPDRGAMARGRFADIVAWDADHEGAFAWAYGLKPFRVWRGGEPVSA